MSIEQDLLALKQKIEKAKSDRDRAEGALEETQKQLKQEFGFTSLEEIDAEITRLDAEIGRAEAGLQEKMRALQEKYDV